MHVSICGSLSKEQKFDDGAVWELEIEHDKPRVEAPTEMRHI